LIAAAQRVEHYEIAGYGCVRTYAKQLGMENAASLLEQTLEEEKETDEKLNTVSESLLKAVEARGEDEDQEKPQGRARKAARA
jgi:ferritin-like metal-binding protein YciE